MSTISFIDADNNEIILIGCYELYYLRFNIYLFIQNL